MTKLSDYVKTAEAAEILGVAQNTIRKWSEQGKLPMRRNPANGYRLFKRTDLEKVLTGGRSRFPREKESKIDIAQVTAEGKSK